MKCWDIFSSDYCRSECRNKSQVQSENENHTTGVRELFITRKDGIKIPVRVSSAPLYDVDGEHVGTVETFQDMTELVNLSSHLEDRFKLPHIIGRSEGMRKIYRLIENVSQSNRPRGPVSARTSR